MGALFDVVSAVTIVVLVLVLVVIGMVRMGWRIWHDNEQMEPGGSMGDQMLASTKHEPVPRKENQDQP